MKRIITQMARHAVLLLSALLPMASVAQDIGAPQGYINVYVRVQTVAAGSGRVSITPPAGGLESYKETVDFQKTLPVAVSAVYFNAKARPADGYSFAGWYVDDGDGQFDIAKDLLASDEPETVLLIPLELLGYDDETPLFETEAEGKAAGMPAEPQLLVHAFFTNGASASVDYLQEDCGTVEISKAVNQPGDVVTIKAIPANGYQFEYWKTGRGTQLFAANPDTSVSTEASYTFTVKGGEHYYAYFSAMNAPVLHFPEEGGWIATSFDATWFLHEQSGAYVYDGELTDIVTNEQGQTFLNLDDEEAIYPNAHTFRNALRGYGNRASLIYGKGEVRFTHYIVGLDFARSKNYIAEWSGPKGITISDKNNEFNYHVYLFSDQAGAFVKYATTDLLADPEHATTTIDVPKEKCYICVEAIDIANPQTGYIPEVIGMTAHAFDHASAGIQESKRTVAPRATYDLQGRRVASGQLKRGLYIVDGKKSFIQ